MANISTEALTQMADSLGNYINEVSKLLDELSDAAHECHENLADDTLSAEALNNIKRIVGQSHSSLQKASQLRNRLQQKAQELIVISNM